MGRLRKTLMSIARICYDQHISRIRLQARHEDEAISALGIKHSRLASWLTPPHTFDHRPFLAHYLIRPPDVHIRDKLWWQD